MRLEQTKKLRERDEKIEALLESGKPLAEIAKALSISLNIVKKISAALERVNDGYPDPRAYGSLPWDEVEHLFFRKGRRAPSCQELGISEEVYEAIRDLSDPTRWTRDPETLRWDPPPCPWDNDADPRQKAFEKAFDAVTDGLDVEERDGAGIAKELDLSKPLVEDMIADLLYRKYDEIPALRREGREDWMICKILGLEIWQVRDFLHPRYPGFVRGPYAYGTGIPGDKGNWLPRERP
jgi:hypothetical protein